MTEWFFDTNFHLNQAGKEVNTVQLIRDIKAMLGDDREVVLGASRRNLTEHGEMYLQKPEYRLQEDSQTYYGEEKIVIPENVMRIEDYAFSSCAGLKQIVLCRKILPDVLRVSIFWMVQARKSSFRRGLLTVISEIISGQCMQAGSEKVTAHAEK